jgi:hypothetical protein
MPPMAASTRVSVPPYLVGPSPSTVSFIIIFLFCLFQNEAKRTVLSFVKPELADAPAHLTAAVCGKIVLYGPP